MDLHSSLMRGAAALGHFALLRCSFLTAFRRANLHTLSSIGPTPTSTPDGAEEKSEGRRRVGTLTLEAILPRRGDGTCQRFPLGRIGRSDGRSESVG
jgi:hypothetical protein